MELSNGPDAVIPCRTRNLGFIVNFNFLLVLTNIYLFGSIVLRETWVL